MNLTEGQRAYIIQQLRLCKDQAVSLTVKGKRSKALVFQTAASKYQGALEGKEIPACSPLLPENWATL